jgi:hypothetical protein
MRNRNQEGKGKMKKSLLLTAAMAVAACAPLFTEGALPVIRAIEKDVVLAAGARTNQLVNTGLMNWDVHLALFSLSATNPVAYAVDISKDGIVRDTVAVADSATKATAVLSGALMLAPGESIYVARPATATGVVATVRFVARPVKRSYATEQAVSMGAGVASLSMTNNTVSSWMVTGVAGELSSKVLPAVPFTVSKGGMVYASGTSEVSNHVFSAGFPAGLFLDPGESLTVAVPSKASGQAAAAATLKLAFGTMPFANTVE